MHSPVESVLHNRIPRKPKSANFHTSTLRFFEQKHFVNSEQAKYTPTHLSALYLLLRILGDTRSRTNDNLTITP